MEGEVVAVCRSVKKGTAKKEIPVGEIIKGFGLQGDAHGGDWHRQVSFLGEESIAKMREHGLELNYGDFAENITTRGLILYKLPVGTWLKVGQDAVFEVTQIGKECHQGCEIFQQVGACVMPKEGIFAQVIHSGTIQAGDKIKVILEKERRRNEERLS